MQPNPWDILGQKTFDTELKEGEIDPRAADNILLAWPPILELLTKHYPQTRGIRVLDFGCGAGGFCNKLDSLGFEVTGIDSSIGMIESAKLHTSPKILYIPGDQNKLPISQDFDVITSMMTFPFIEKISETFKTLTGTLNPNGLICMAVFNPEWVKACLQAHISFADFDSNDNPKIGKKIFGELQTSVYIRSAQEYSEIAESVGLLKILEVNPPFTPEFISKYPDNRPKHLSEYIILGFQKKQNFRF